MTQTINIADITITDPTNGRAAVNPQRVGELADHLAQEPLLHPITLRPKGKGWELIAGRHRLAAFVKLGRTAIQATIIHANDLQTATLRLAENVSRSQLSPVEEAHQLAALVNHHPGGAEMVARDLGRPLNWILDRIEMLSWPDDLLAHVHAKRITLAAAKLLDRIQPPDLRAQRIADAANHGCSAATARLWLQHAGADNPHAPPAPMFLSQPGEPRYETLTKVLCYGCRELKLLEKTHSLRWCDECMVLFADIPQDHPEQSPMLTPHVYDPPAPQTQPSPQRG